MSSTQRASLNRHIIPRWRPIASAMVRRETTWHRTKNDQPIARAKSEISIGDLDDLANEFQRDKSVGVAADLVGAAFSLARPEVAFEAAKYLGKQKSLPSLARKIVSLCLGEEVSGRWEILSTPKDVIQWFRADLRSDSPSPFGWCDLALAYASLGLYDKAKRTLRVARNLAPHDRFILRATVRLEHHIGDSDRGLALLRSDLARLRSDPWLLAAELGLSQFLGEKQKYTGVARKLLKEDLQPIHLSELSAALGTIELETGNKLARKLFRKSLQDPTDVTVAQVVWSREFDKAIKPPSEAALRISAEGRAKSAYVAGDWQASVEASFEWLKDEPFSTLPALHGSGVAAVKQDYVTAERIAMEALKVNPGNPHLINNLAYALAEQSHLREAKEKLKEIDVTKLEDSPIIHCCYLATKGLITFLSGEPNQGRKFYLSAMERAKKAKFPSLQAKAASFLARESRKAGLETAEEDCNTAKELVAKIKKTNYPEKKDIEQTLAFCTD